MNSPALPPHLDDEPPSNWLLVVAFIATFLAGVMAATAFMVGSGACRAEASNHVEP
jgi:hypothetical protein